MSSAAAAAARPESGSPRQIRVNLNLTTSRPTPPGTPSGASAAERPALGRANSKEASFDLTTLRKFNKLFSEGKVEQAVTLMAEDVQWFAFDGRVIVGRAECQKLFEEQKKLGLKRRPLTDWILQVKKPDEDQDLASFSAQRVMQFEKPEGVPSRLVQTMHVKRGQITICVVEAAVWEEGLEPLELLLRFGSLRSSQKNDQAASFLDENCEWGRMDIPDIFTAPPELSAACIKGPELIKQLWIEQEKQDVKRALHTDWQEEAGSASEAGGQMFSRQIKVSGKGGAKPRLWRQSARVVDGRITEVSHREEAAAGLVDA